MEATLGGRILGALVLVGLVGTGVWYLNKKTDIGTKVAAATSGDVLNVGINTWSGFAGLIAANGGLEPNTDSRFFKESKLLVKISIFDNPNDGRQAFQSGAIDTWQGTVDSIPVDAATLLPSGFKYFVQTDWSNGGDVIVATDGIRNVSQLKGKTIAVAEGSPSHSLLLSVVKSGELKLSDLNIKKVSDGSEAAKLFKAGTVDAAVVWSPDDQDCLQAIKGSTILVSTKKASRIIADALYAKSSFISSNREKIKALAEGILNENAEINSNEVAHANAVKILARSFNMKESDAAFGISNARLTTYGDNLNFFGLNSSYAGVTGQELYDRMNTTYNEIGMAPANNPNWRQIFDSSIVQDIKLVGAIHVAEAEPTFNKVSASVAQSKPVFSNKKLSVNFPLNSATLTSDAKNIIRSNFSAFAKGFNNARILIEGNTDRTGDDTINVPLSHNRANSAKAFLVQNYGIDPNRVTVVGNGSKYATGDDDSDRRTDFKLLND